MIYCDSVHNFAIEGFTITDGLANGEDTDASGGGIYCRDSAPTVQNCTISGNSANEDGGGIYCRDSSPTIKSCIISGNASTVSTYASGGGINCFHSSPTIQDCTISSNSAVYTGGGIYNENCTVTMDNCTITANSATWGGGTCWFDGSVTIHNCVFTGNSAADTGGGIWFQDSTSDIVNCTVTGNSANEGGGGIYWRKDLDVSLPRAITNCIFSNNGRNQWPDAIISYCDIENDMPSGEGNFWADPLFVTGPLGEYYLHPDSPCIDAGSRSAEEAGLSDRTTRADGTPDTGTVDMGYHYPIP